jgi:prevent-host-death family protein
MQATSKDLRFHTKEILDAAIRGEDVVITYHGKPYVKIVPITSSSSSNKSNEFCGMWKDRTDMEDVQDYVRTLRQGRKF